MAKQLLFNQTPSSGGGGEAHGTLTAIAAPTSADWTCPKSGNYHIWFTNSNRNGQYDSTMTLNGTPLNTLGHQPQTVFITAYDLGMCYANLSLTEGDVIHNGTYNIGCSMIIFETTLDIIVP